jgi:hypothetical protein
VIQDLTVQRNLTITAAQAINASYIDLNEASTTYLNSIGATNAALYNRIVGDFTHLNIAGDILFGNMVSMLIGDAVKSVPGGSITPFTYPNATIAEAISSGTFVLPSAFVY